MDRAVNYRALIFLLTLGLFTIGECQKPQIVNDILPEIKRVGMTATLNCTVAKLDKELHSVQWSFKNPQGTEIISINKDIKVWNERKGTKTYRVQEIHEKGDRITYSLTINRLRPEYDGIYECSININSVPDKEWPRKTGQIVVLQAPIIRPGSTDAVKLIEKGDNSSITCNAVGVPPPNITWVRSDGLLLPNGKAMFRGRTLPIKIADVRYSGVYKCVADNSIKPTATSLTQVYVFQEPTVRVLQDSVGQLANGKLMAKLDCIVQGYPTPSVNWMIKDGSTRTVLKDSDKFETTKQATDQQNLFNGEQWYTLTIKYVQALDFREYYCVGNNSKGEGFKIVTLFSTPECQGPLCYSMDVRPTGRGGGETTFDNSAMWTVAVISLVNLLLILRNRQLSFLLI